MDVSLDDLLSGLQAVQQKKSTAKLSERNVVELVNKLKQLGLLGDDLLHTTNGKEYITREQVAREVKQAVVEAGGRIPLVDLPGLLGLDLVHCERAAEQLTSEGGAKANAAAATGDRTRSRSSSSGVFQAQGELFMPLYFDGLAAEVDEGLQETGVVALGEVARRYGLAADLLAAQLEARVGSLIHGKLEGGVIYTPAYLARIKAQLRGALRGALAPVTMQTLVKELSLEGLGPLHALLPSLIDQLLAEGSIAGKLTGGATSWVPALFVKSQQDAVKRFFQQNGYIGYDTVSKYGIAAPRQFLPQHFPDGIALDSAFVAPSVVDQVEACAEEALQAGSWCDVQPVLPSILSTSDAAALLGRCLPRLQQPAGGGAGQARILSGTVIMAPSFLDSIREVLLEEARQAAEDAHRKQQGGAGQQGAPQGGEAAKGPSTQKPGGAAESDDDDDWSTGKGKGKKGKAKKGGKALPAKSAGKQGKAGKPQQAQQDDTPAAASILTVGALAQRITSLHPDVEGAGADGELASDLATELRPAVVAEYERALHAIFTAGAERRRRLREAAGAALDVAHQRLQLYAHGAQLFVDDESTSATLDRHLLRSAAADCMDALLRYLAADLALDEGQEAQQQQGEAGGQGPLSPGDRATIVKQLGPDVKPAASAALEKLGGSSLEAFVSEFDAAAEAAGLRLRKLDKKAERSRVAEQQRAWQAQLAAEGDPSAALLLLVPCLLAKHEGRVVSLPGRALGAAVERLKPSLPEHSYTLLSDFHSAVVEQLKVQGQEQEGSRGSEQLQLLMEAAKQLAAEGGARENTGDQ
ncbi:hypothetical protein N2152v2_003918 [Parachlorella kessleri]